MKFLAQLFFLLMAGSLIAQNPVGEAASLYWKNRKPNEAYWQQDVEYTIVATLDDEKDRISGSMTLVYRNNSPDELSQLFFHLYQNMFEPESYANASKKISAKASEEVFQHTEVLNLKVEGRECSLNKDNTILNVVLNEPIKSGESASITCDFVTQFGPQSGRMKVYSDFGYKHFNVVHWYPRISVYDRKFGWTADQHLGHEFYGDFGKFKVNLNVPEQYILDGTGWLKNRDEVLPSELMSKLDIRNFKDKPWNEKPSQIIEPTGKIKTWQFEAENVHDFAWTADPTYRIGIAEAELKSGRKVVCYALAQEQHASGWQNAADYAARIIEVYSNDIGEYAYHKMIVADARDGMEYPMLTLDGGRDMGYRDLFAHEIGHNWFFGMVGSNETYRAALDEGFTQFLTVWCMERLEGDTYNLNPNTGLDKRLSMPRTFRDLEAYDGYYFSSIIRDDNPTLNTHSDQFESGRQYGQVYSKTAVMLYNLQYVLGDDLFQKAIQHYFNQWKFCHPYLEDFRSSIIQYSGVDLNWFFDQWLETNKKIDYSIGGVKKQKDGQYEITFKRIGAMQMPIEFSIFDKAGEESKYLIPNTWFVKSTDAKVLPKWTGWNDFNDTYKATVSFNQPIKKIVIDPSNRLADVNQLNNTKPTAVTLRLDNMTADWNFKNYAVEWRPSLWYNGFDGLKLGFETKGSYASVFHQFESAFWFSSGLGQQSSVLEYPAFQNDFFRIQYRIGYSTPLRGISKRLDLVAKSRWIDGLSAQSLGYRKELLNNKTSISQSVSSLWRPENASLNYLLYPDQWNVDQWNNFLETSIEHKYGYGEKSRGHLTSTLRNPLFWSDYNYGYLNLEAVNDNRFSRFNFRTRCFGQLGLGSDWAPESKLWAAGANPEEMSQNSMIRSVGFVPSSIYGIRTTVGNFQSGGGLNLRGYNNYLLPEYNADSSLRFTHSGTSGIAFNTEFEFNDLVKTPRKFNQYIAVKTYLFADAGLINLNYSFEPIQFARIRADAGLGAALQIKNWWIFRDLKPITLRLDLPLFLNRPPAGQEYLQFRWLFAIDRAF